MYLCFFKILLLFLSVTKAELEDIDDELNDDDTIMEKRGFEIEDYHPAVYNAFKNYRKLLKNQRWKKSKMHMDMYRPAYGFGKRAAPMSFRMISPFNFYTRNTGLQLPAF